MVESATQTDDFIFNFRQPTLQVSSKASGGGTDSAQSPPSQGSSEVPGREDTASGRGSNSASPLTSRLPLLTGGSGKPPLGGKPIPPPKPKGSGHSSSLMVGSVLVSDSSTRQLVALSAQKNSKKAVPTGRPKKAERDQIRVTNMYTPLASDQDDEEQMEVR